MSEIGSSSELDIWPRLIKTGLILLVMLIAFFYVKHLIKSKGPSVQEFLGNKLPFLGFAKNKKAEYKIELLEKQAMGDGSELLVVEVNERHILLGKTPSGGMNYLTDLNEKNLINDKTKVPPFG